MMNELSNDPIQSAMAALEKQHEEDKQSNFFLSIKALYSVERTFKELIV